ncbi:MAG: tetratricopeptide repeat protein [bacterium]
MKSIRLTICLLIIFVVLSLSVYAENDDSLLIKGISNYYNGLYNDTVDNLDAYLGNKSNRITAEVDALYYQTLAYLELNDIVNSKSNIKILKDKGYQLGVLHWKLGKVYLNEKGYFDSSFYNEAKRELQIANELGISSPDFHVDLAIAHQGLGNLEKAVDEYELALEKGINVTDYINLASLYKEVGRLDSALELYKKVQNEIPDNISIYLNMGNIYLEKQNYKLAIDIFKKGLEVNDAQISLQTKLAQAYYMNGNYDNAKTKFHQIIEKNKNIYQAYYYLAEIYKHEENIDLAIEYYKRAIDYNNNYLNAYLSLGNVYLDQDKLYKAMTQFLKALESNPNHSSAHYYLALAYHKMDMKEAAIEELRKTLHLNPDNNEAKLLLEKLQGNRE